MKIDFTITDRDGEKALWANGINIWDLKPSELTEDIKKAIINAVYVGLDLAREEIDQLDFGRSYFKEFKEVKK